MIADDGADYSGELSKVLGNQHSFEVPTSDSEISLIIQNEVRSYPKNLRITFQSDCRK